MKNKVRIFITIISLFCLPLRALAVEHNFPAGSLIIPMDSFYQPDTDGGILEAYGLTLYLLKAGVSIYWIINTEKTEINGTDVVIEDLSLEKDKAVVKLYDHKGGTTNLTFKPGDNPKKITYIGAPFIVDGSDAEKAKEVINQDGWAAVEVHEAQVPFKAPVYRKMEGALPKIALMDSSEKGGNAAILESYLRLAGICTDIYEVVTPNQIRDGILQLKDYDFLWAPHWEGYNSYSEDADGDGVSDVEEIVANIKKFLLAGKGMLAECASIETFEHSKNGRFLSTKGFGHNGGTNKAEDIIYNDKSLPYSQIGDFPFVPEGGHLHNWRPFVYGDPYSNVGDPPSNWDEDKVTESNPSVYRNTVTRFTIDNTGWDYYVGGYAYGNRDYGYVVYLGGHKYAACKRNVSEDVNPEPEIHRLDFEFNKNISNESFTLVVKYNGVSNSTVTFNKNELTAKAGSPLELDLTTASVKNKRLTEVTFRNKGDSTITVDSITLFWNGGDTSQTLKKITDTKTDYELYNDKRGVSSGVELTANFTIGTTGGESAICTYNDDCSWKNIAGVRYVLNTLFDIKYMLTKQEYTRATPITSFPYLYQGSFEYPSFKGHFRCYDVRKDSANPEEAIWDTADHIKDSDTRQIFTARQERDGTWSRIGFDASHIEELRALLNLTPKTPAEGGNDTDEIQLINRVRGNKLGGIMHSAPAIVGPNSRTNKDREEIAYVGDLYGMLHAIETKTGKEKWAYIPRNLLGKLKNDRTDPYAFPDFAAVDASPTVRDIYYDHDNDGDKEWRTILVCPEGMGGRYLFALDVTNPDDVKVLWEVTDQEDPGGGMGHAYRAAIGKVKWPVKYIDDPGKIVLNEKSKMPYAYETKWVVFVATGYAKIAEEHGGISIFAYDLKTGKKLWRFSQDYQSAINDIPGAISLFDIDGDTFADRLYVGDMEGRMWELNTLWESNWEFKNELNPGQYERKPDGVGYYVGHRLNPNGTYDDFKYPEYADKQVPLWDAGVGKPISVSPAVTRFNPVVVIFGTGGADWADDNERYKILAIDATDKNPDPDPRDPALAGAGTLLWEKDTGVGEKVWSSPTVAAKHIYISTATGTMESHDPANDKMGTGYLYNLNLADGSGGWVTDDGLVESISIRKSRGAPYVDRKHIYLTTIDNQVIQIGDGNFTAPPGNRVILQSWREIWQ